MNTLFNKIILQMDEISTLNTAITSHLCYHSYDQIDYTNVLTVCSIKNRSKLVQSVFRGILRGPIFLSGPDVNNIILLYSTDPHNLLNVTYISLVINILRQKNTFFLLGMQNAVQFQKVRRSSVTTHNKFSKISYFRKRFLRKKF